MIGEDVNLLKLIFLVGKVSKFLAVGWDYSSISKVFYKGLGGGKQTIPDGGNKATSKERTLLVTKEIQEVESAGHCFVLRDLVLKNCPNI